MTTFNNKSYIPTALFFETDNRDPFFGQKAIDHYISGESGRLVRSIKRILGTDLIGKYTLINDKWYKYDRFVQMFLTYLKQATEQTLQETIDCVVMGRPVHFQDDNETADKQAQKTLETLATLAGLKHIVFFGLVCLSPNAFDEVFGSSRIRKIDFEGRIDREFFSTKAIHAQQQQ